MEPIFELSSEEAAELASLLQERQARGFITKPTVKDKRREARIHILKLKQTELRRQGQKHKQEQQQQQHFVLTPSVTCLPNQNNNSPSKTLRKAISFTDHYSSTYNVKKL